MKRLPLYRGPKEPVFWVIKTQEVLDSKVRTVAWNCYTAHRKDKGGRPLVTLKWRREGAPEDERPEARAIMCVVSPMTLRNVLDTLQRVAAVTPEEVVPE